MENNYEENKLQLIPKSELYMQYMIELLNKLPRVEKFNIGNKYKKVMYEMHTNIYYLQKVGMKNWLPYLNRIDCELNIQRSLIRNKTYKHGGYTSFYVTEPKLRKIEKSRYIDRIIHHWLVHNFLEPIYVPKFINTSFACLKNKGMHKSALYVQKAMKHAKYKWGEYYILKMDIAKYFDNINKNIKKKHTR